MACIELHRCIPGPPDKTLKYKVSPWSVMTDTDSVNVTVTFTPGKSLCYFLKELT